MVLFLLQLSVLAVFALSCKEKAALDILPEPYQNLILISPDSLHNFSVGDTFLLSVSENSCCQYGWGQDSAFVEAFPGSPLVRVADQFDVPFEEGCDGCSSFTYYALVCTSAGTDTLVRYQIPMGDLGGNESNNSIPANILSQQTPSLFIFHVE